MVGATLLVRITYLLTDETVSHVAEFAGVVSSVDPLVTIEQGDNESFTLPPDPDAYEAAAPGEYRLRSTGETVLNPDFISMWTVHLSPER